MTTKFLDSLKIISSTTTDLFISELANLFERKEYYSTIRNSEYFNNPQDRSKVSLAVDQMIEKQKNGECIEEETVELSDGDKITIYI